MVQILIERYVCTCDFSGSNQKWFHEIIDGNYEAEEKEEKWMQT